MFGNTYVRESIRTFSTMKQVKSKIRNRWQTKHGGIRLAATKASIERGTIVSEEPQAQAFH